MLTICAKRQKSCLSYIGVFPLLNDPIFRSQYGEHPESQKHLLLSLQQALQDEGE